MNRPPFRARPWRALVLLVGLAACASTPEEQSTSVEDQLLPGERARARMEDQPLGLFLRDLNGSIRAWTQLTMTARSVQDQRKVDLLELDLNRRTIERIDELILELEAGPPQNRVIAASALGFTQDERALSPLLAALEDPDVEVQSNALLGLRLLGSEDTPLERVCELMRYGADGWVRSNAASCASTLINTGIRSDCVLEAARGGLSDPEPGVRSHSALILATLLDSRSVGMIANLLYDDVPLVQLAAIRSLTYIGTRDLTTKADVASALVGAFVGSTGVARVSLLRGLEALSGRHYGENDDEWREWAARLR